MKMTLIRALTVAGLVAMSAAAHASPISMYVLAHLRIKLKVVFANRGALGYAASIRVQYESAGACMRSSAFSAS